MTTTDLTRNVHVEHCMGTVFTIDVRDPGEWEDAIAECVAWLHRVDSVFSTYRADSDVSRIRRGELTVADADPDVAEVAGLCEWARVATCGYFSAQWRGGFDPTGLVKGWAVQRAGEVLREHGSRNHAINGGGDMRLAGQAAADRPWRVGISDPLRPGRIMTVVSGTDTAVATSGAAERGSHIVNPLTGAPAAELAAVTVTGPSLTTVDAYATAAVAMGPDALAWLEERPGHEALVVTATGETGRTSGFGR